MPWADQEQFQEIYKNEGARQATSWLYDQSKALNLIHRDGTTSGIHWVHDSKWGPILISVNEAKPEKDPRDIAKAAKQDPSTSKTQDSQSKTVEECVFCWESPNEKNHLRIRLDLQGKPYSLHYSPYAYFPEHCIVSTEEHRPMLIDRRTFEDLLELCTRFPDYFFGSNADLPIVGGSILNHHHYQGGLFTFPLDNAPTLQTIHLPGYDGVSASLLNWPLSCIRLVSRKKDELLDAASKILAWWKDYTDIDANIIAVTPDGAHHNTITPIARINNGSYQFDLVLRCNITSEAYPLGIFHPHEEVHCVKKENIGLIEAMGLAILPPRVKEQFVLEDGSSDNDRTIVGDLFTRGLEQCGVLSNDEIRQRALASLNEFFLEHQ